MSFENAFYEALEAAIKVHGQKKFADLVGIKQARLSKIMAAWDARKQGLPKPDGAIEYPGLDAVAKIFDNFDKNTFLSFAQNAKPTSSLVVMDIEGYRQVNVYKMESIKTMQELLAQTPLFTLRIPQEYYPSDFGVFVYGHHMEDEFPERSAVGIKRLHDVSDFIAGENYLCNLDYEGLALRRVQKTEDGRFEFTATNKKYRSEILSPDKALCAILGKITWVSKRV